jgi:hypothetical protein
MCKIHSKPMQRVIPCATHSKANGCIKIPPSPCNFTKHVEINLLKKMKIDMEIET